MEACSRSKVEFMKILKKDLDKVFLTQMHPKQVDAFSKSGVGNYMKSLKSNRGPGRFKTDGIPI